MTLPKFLTTVTTFSKILAAVLFISLPFLGFFLGQKYEEQFMQYLEGPQTVTYSPTEKKDASTTNWKTYRNEKMRIEFKYPEKYGSYIVKVEEYDQNYISLVTNPSSSEYPTYKSSSLLQLPLLSFNTNKSNFINYKSLSLCVPINSQDYTVPCLNYIEDKTTPNIDLKKFYIEVSDTNARLYFQTIQEPYLEITGDEVLLDKILPTFKFINQEDQTVCTQDVKLCPDGKTYVGRAGPNCEFAACPQ